MAAPREYNSWLNQAAAAYGMDPGVLDKVAVLESGRQPHVVNTTDSNAAAGHPSTGILQFIPSTFRSMAQQARAANPAAWRGVPMNTNDYRAQLLAGAWGMTHGQGSAWSTWDRAQGARGTQPVPTVQSAVASPQNASGGFTPAQTFALQMVFDKPGSMHDLVQNAIAARAARNVANTGTNTSPAAPQDAAFVSGAFPAGKIIGTPYHGTHTLGNWQSDNAIDIALHPGTPIYAESDGVIVNPGTVGGGGPGNGSGRFDGYKTTLQGPGNSWWYGHLQKLVVGAGDHVKRGQLIGYSGSANGVAHLHLGQMHGSPHYG